MWRVPYQRTDGARLCAEHPRNLPFMGFLTARPLVRRLSLLLYPLHSSSNRTLYGSMSYYLAQLSFPQIIFRLNSTPSALQK